MRLKILMLAHLLIYSYIARINYALLQLWIPKLLRQSVKAHAVDDHFRKASKADIQR